VTGLEAGTPIVIRWVGGGELHVPGNKWQWWNTAGGPVGILTEEWNGECFYPIQTILSIAEDQFGVKVGPEYSR
jgi:hypothetical protein